MSKPSGASVSPAAPATTANKRIPYSVIRDGFLAEIPANDQEWLEYYARIGGYVFKRWQAIAADTPGEEMDEVANEHRWDECTTRGLETIRDETHQLILREVQRQRVRAAWKAWRSQSTATRRAIGGLTWLAWRVWEHFWGAIGIVAFGLILLWLAPQFIQEVRTRADALFPAETSPHSPSTVQNDVQPSNSQDKPDR